MSLLFMDSFDHYATADLFNKWTANQSGSPVISATNGRRSSASLRTTSNGFIWKGLNASGATAVIGVAFRISSLLNFVKFIGIHDSATARDQISINLNTDGSLAVYRGNTSSTPGSSPGALIGASAAGIITANTYYYIEAKIVINATTGSVVVRVNGTIVLNLTGQNTSNTTLVWSTLFLGSNAIVTSDFDDLYVLDGTGSAPWNDFLGDVRVDARFPTGPGATTQWTPLSGANWQNVDDPTPNGDTDYNSTSAVNQTDTFATQDAPIPGAAIFGVQQNLYIRKTDAGIATMAPVIRHAGVDNVGATLSPATSYVFGIVPNQTNPGTSAQWTEAGFNAAEFGYKRLT